MGIRAKLREIFIDYSDLEKANQEIGYLKDLCDSKDKTIGYQAKLLEIQGESVKMQRKALEDYKKIEDSFNKLKEELYDNTRNKKRK